MEKKNPAPKHKDDEELEKELFVLNKVRSFRGMHVFDVGCWTSFLLYFTSASQKQVKPPRKRPKLVPKKKPPVKKHSTGGDNVINIIRDVPLPVGMLTRSKTSTIKSNVATKIGSKPARSISTTTPSWPPRSTKTSIDEVPLTVSNKVSSFREMHVFDVGSWSSFLLYLLSHHNSR